MRWKKKVKYKAKTKIILSLDLDPIIEKAREEIANFPLGEATLELCIKQGMVVDHELLVSIAQVCGVYSADSAKFIHLLGNVRDDNMEEPEQDIDSEDSLNNRAKILLENLSIRREEMGIDEAQDYPLLGNEEA